MRIGILADTHDQVRRTGIAVRRLIAEGAQALIHCGDVTGPDVIYECAGLPAHFVFGNNDYDEEGLRGAMALIGGTCLDWAGEIVLGERRIAVTHGDSTGTVRRLSQAEPDYLLFGHTHVASDVRIGRTRFINPGALHRASTWTVAVLDTDTDQLQMINISDR
jgi:putative phosphoesterase